MHTGLSLTERRLLLECELTDRAHAASTRRPQGCGLVLSPRPVPVEEPLGTSKCSAHTFSLRTRTASVDTRVFTSFSEHPQELSEAFLTPQGPCRDAQNPWRKAPAGRRVRLWAEAEGLRCGRGSVLPLCWRWQDSPSTVSAFLCKREHSPPFRLAKTLG